VHPAGDSSTRNRLKQAARDVLSLSVLTAFAVGVNGYHYGIEDMAVYLPAIKKLLHPSLYPLDANFFLLYIRLTSFHQIVANVVRVSHLPLEWVSFLWYIASIFLLLFGALRLVRRCFASPAAHWAGVSLLAALLTMPVAGTALFIVDQHMHPRTTATAFLLLALVDVLAWRPVTLLWIFLAGICHPTMAFYGTFHIAVLGLARPLSADTAALASIPFGIPANPIWREVMSRRTFQYPFKWPWYEWLGVAAPLGFMIHFATIAAREGAPVLTRVCRRMILSTVIGTIAALTLTEGFETQTWARLEPMRILHLFYVVFVVVFGGFIGRYLLRERWLRWCMVFVPLSILMFSFQRMEFSSSHHIEWPVAQPKNLWVQAFVWASHNSPTDALFAFDPKYMSRSGEDYYGFRGFAERSAFADNSKDPSVVEVFPDLAWQWKLETDAIANWNRFSLADFKRLKRDYHISWVVVEQPGVSGLICPYSNSAVEVCEIP